MINDIENYIINMLIFLCDRRFCHTSMDISQSQEQWRLRSLRPSSKELMSQRDRSYSSKRHII